MHGGAPYCRVHYLETAGEICGAWRDRGRRSASAGAPAEECLKCAERAAAVSRPAYLHEGRPVNPEARVSAAPRCHSAASLPSSAASSRTAACITPSVFDASTANTSSGAQVCGLRRGLSGGVLPEAVRSSAGEALRTQVHGTLKRHAIAVPLLLSLGGSALQALQEKHEELLPQVRRLLREAGIVQFASFLFQPPLVSKPSMVLHMLIPASLDAEHALPSLLQEDRIGQQWMELLTAAHDTAAARGNPWWSTYSRSSERWRRTQRTGELTR